MKTEEFAINCADAEKQIQLSLFISRSNGDRSYQPSERKKMPSIRRKYFLLLHNFPIRMMRGNE